MEEEENLTNTIDQMSLSFEESCSRAPIFVDYHDPKLIYVNDGSLHTLYLTPDEISKVLVLRKHTKTCQQISQIVYQKIEGLRSEIIKGSASRRLQDSFYKLIPCLK